MEGENIMNNKENTQAKDQTDVSPEAAVEKHTVRTSPSSAAAAPMLEPAHPTTAAPEATNEALASADSKSESQETEKESSQTKVSNKEESKDDEDTKLSTSPNNLSTLADKESLAKSPPPPTNKDDNMEESKQENTKEDDSAALQRPIKRARTAYFIFAEDKRPELQKKHAGEGVAVVAKALGQLWAALPDEEKQVYQQKAAAERSRVQAELQARQAAGILPEPKTASPNLPSDPAALVFPLGRMRKIIKLDPEVRGLSKEALALVTKAAECCLVKLGQESVRVANVQNRRKLLPEDVAMVCQTRSAFAFLKEDLQDLVAQQTQVQQANTSSSSAGTKRKAEMPSQSNKLTSYFAVKSNDS